MSTRRAGVRHRRGQAAVEFALVLPFLLVMLIGIIEFGRAWNEHQVITDAAREAARKGAIADATVNADTIINTAKRAMAAAGMNPEVSTITLNNWDGGSNTNLTVAISHPYQFTFFGPLVAWTTGQSQIDLQTSFTMRNE